MIELNRKVISQRVRSIWVPIRNWTK